MSTEFFIEGPEDFQQLEARIAKELRCREDRCAFLRTAMFRHLRLRVLYRTADQTTEDMVLPTPQGMVVRLVRGSKLVRLEWPPLLQEYSGWREEHMPGEPVAGGHTQYEGEGMISTTLYSFS